MHTSFITIFIVITSIIVLLLINELAVYFIYGKFVDKKELNYFLEKNLVKYRINDLSYNDGRQQLWSMDLPYIAITPSIFSKWYIEDYGRISRWSKWHKEINKLWNESEKPIKKTLLDY